MTHDASKDRLLDAALALQDAALDAAREAAPDPEVIATHMQAVTERRRVLMVQVSRSGSRAFVSVTTAPVGARSDVEIFHLLDLEHRVR